MGCNDNIKTQHIPIPLVRTGRSESMWVNGIMDILGSIRIFYADDGDL